MAVVTFVGFLLAISASNAQVTEHSKAAGLEQCVEPTEFMRKNHMEVLLHQRDLTMRKGERASKHSLVGCVECHASRDADDGFVSVVADGQFCQTCHATVAVEMDCFQCHASKPEQNASMIRPMTVALADGGCRIE